MAPFPGGIVVKNSEGKIIGAIGVSGASGDEDEYSAIRGVVNSKLNRDYRQSLEEEDEIALQTEVDILSQIDHPNVVKLYEIFDDKECMYLVLELMTGGEVFKFAFTLCILVV